MLTQRQALRIPDKYLLLFVNIKKWCRITAICHCQFFFFLGTLFLRKIIIVKLFLRNVSPLKRTLQNTFVIPGYIITLQYLSIKLDIFEPREIGDFRIVKKDF